MYKKNNKSKEEQKKKPSNEEEQIEELKQSYQLGIEYYEKVDKKQ